MSWGETFKVNKPPSEQKAKTDKQQLADDIEQFLANGGKIQVLEGFKSTPSMYARSGNEGRSID